jgi:sulfatase modifying factor 1
MKCYKFAVAAAVVALTAPCALSQQSATAPEFLATVSNLSVPPKPAPDGMVWIPGGEFSMGSKINGQGSCEMPMASDDTEPVHRVRVDGFWMDATVVTNEQFETFVRRTGYITIAERTPTKEEFPGAPAENLVAGGLVFTPTTDQKV